MEGIRGKNIEKAKQILGEKSITKKVISLAKELEREYKKRLALAFSTGLAFVIGLYINNTLRHFVDYLLKQMGLSEAKGLLWEFIIALIVIGICVVGIVLISKWGET